MKRRERKLILLTFKRVAMSRTFTNLLNNRCSFSWHGLGYVPAKRNRARPEGL